MKQIDIQDIRDLFNEFLDLYCIQPNKGEKNYGKTIKTLKSFFDFLNERGWGVNYENRNDYQMINGVRLRDNKDFFNGIWKEGLNSIMDPNDRQAILDHCINKWRTKEKRTLSIIFTDGCIGIPKNIEEFDQYFRWNLTNLATGFKTAIEHGINTFMKLPFQNTKQALNHEYTKLIKMLEQQCPNCGEITSKKICPNCGEFL